MEHDTNRIRKHLTKAMAAFSLLFLAQLRIGLIVR